MNKYIFYIGNFKAGKMDAQTQLILGNSSILKELGYTVVLIGNDNTLVHNSDEIYSKCSIDGVECYNFRFNKSIRDLKNRNKVHFELVNLLSTFPTPEFIICYGSLTFASETKRLYLWCKTSNVPLLFNCVELPSLSHGNVLERFIKYIDWNYRERIIRYKSDGIIAITEYIKEHYSKYNKNPITIIPPLKDTKEFNKPPLNSNKIIRLVYVGVPFPIDGRKVDEAAYKDRIDLFIDLLYEMRNEGLTVSFDIYGITKQQYLDVVKRHKQIIEKMKEVVHFHERISHEEAIKNVSKADFSIVYRMPNKMTMAGFSSKLVESISSGTPVLLSETSDYLNYLKHGETCFILDIKDHKKAVIELQEILNISKKTINEMKQNCYELRKFDYRNYIDQVNNYLSSVKQSFHSK